MVGSLGSLGHQRKFCDKHKVPLTNTSRSIIKYLTSVFQHYSSNPVFDSLQTIFFSIKEKPSPTGLWTQDHLKKCQQAPALPSELSHLLIWNFNLSFSVYDSVNHFLSIIYFVLLPICIVSFCFALKLLHVPFCLKLKK